MPSASFAKQGDSSFLCYNPVMKKLVLYALICIALSASIPAQASEIAEDYLDMATSYCVSGNYTQALDYLNKILILEPGNRDILGLKNGLKRLQSGNSTSIAVSNNVKLQQAENFKKVGDKSKEFENLTAAVNAGGYWPNMFMGDYYKNSRAYSQAIPYYQKALNSQSKSSEPLLDLGICYHEMKNYSQAHPLLTEFLAYNQQEGFAYAMRAKNLMEMGRYNDAETDIVTAIALEDNIEHRYLESMILYKRGNYKKAKTSFEKIAGEIQTSEIYKCIGLADYALGDLNSALINLDKAIILSKDDKALLSKYNEIKLKLNDTSMNIRN